MCISAELEGVVCVSTILIFIICLLCAADDFRLGVVVTEEGNLILTVTLQNAIPRPVKLKIKYTWAVQPDQVERATGAFENTTEIFHAVSRSRSEVPFQQFRIQVALEVGGVVGPFGLENATIISKYSGLHSGITIIPVYYTVKTVSD